MLFWRLGYIGEKLGHTPYVIESHTFKLHKKTGDFRYIKELNLVSIGKHHIGLFFDKVSKNTHRNNQG